MVVNCHAEIQPLPRLVLVHPLDMFSRRLAKLYCNTTTRGDAVFQFHRIVYKVHANFHKYASSVYVTLWRM